MPPNSDAWKNDPNIFRPDGRIHFPRSDGDLAYGPPNTDEPRPNELQVNYFHVWKPSDPKYRRWCETIGADLARLAGKGETTADGVPWVLDEFPRGYQFTEQRKGPKNSPRTDPYLFGSKAHRFRSTKEFVPHAEWLLSNPQMNTSRCACKYCTGNRRQSEISAVSSPLPSRRAPAPRRPNAASGSGSGAGPSTGGPRGRPRKSGAHIRVKVKATDLNIQDVNESNFLPPSVELRDKELSRAATAGKGGCEGFRIGEHVWVLLEEPIADPADASRYIDKWTAKIVDYRIKAHVIPQEQSAGGEADFGLGNTTSTDNFSLEGRVKQEMHYDVVLIGAPKDKATVPESRLLPYLAGYPNDALAESNFEDMSYHAWMQEGDRLPPKLHVLDTSPEAKAQRPAFPTLLSSFAFSLTAINFHRSAFRATDRWELPRDVPAASLAVENGASASASTDDAAAKAPAPKRHYRAGEYYQGLFAGCERIWAGDLVRLTLKENDVKDMMASLAESGKLARPSDSTEACDLQGSYVMRVRTIRPHTDKPTQLSLVGSVYQVMTQVAFNKRRMAEEAAAAKAAVKGGEPSEDASANGADSNSAGKAAGPSSSTEGAVSSSPTQDTEKASAEPSAGIAMPVFGLLTGRGQHLPATPHLPDGLVLSPIAKDDHQVEVIVFHLAGRIYPSLAQEGDADEVEQIYTNRKSSLSARSSMADRNMARLALLGALPGHLITVGIDTQRFDDGTQAMQESLELARVDVEKKVKEAILGPEVSEGEEGGDADEIEDADGQSQSQSVATSNAAIEAIALAAELSHGASAAARDGDAGGASPAGMGAANPITPAPGPSKKRKATDAPPGSSSPAPAVRTSSNGSTAGNLSGVSTPAQSSSQGAGSNTGDAEGPLPPGWEQRKSRKGLGTFYVNLETRETSWTRPKGPRWLAEPPEVRDCCCAALSYPLFSA